MASDRRRAGQLHVALFIEATGGDWHSKRLVAALENRGFRVSVSTLSACAFDTTAPCGLDIPGFDGQLPDGVFVRAVSQGSLEQITFRLGILHALSASGVCVWNPAQVVERCVDKSTSTFLFQRAGLPTPRTRTQEDREKTERYVTARGVALVSKPLFGSQGRDVTQIHGPSDLAPPDHLGHVDYVQDYVGAPNTKHFTDWRVLVSNNRVVATMKRQSKTWVTNVFKGSTPQAHVPSDTMQTLALQAANAVGACYAGVDLIETTDGDLLVLEVNSNPAWKGLQAVSKTNIAQALADDFASAVRQTVASQTCPTQR